MEINEEYEEKKGVGKIIIQHILFLILSILILVAISASLMVYALIKVGG